MTMRSIGTVTILFCCARAHEDEKLLRKFKKHLSILQRLPQQKRISLQYDLDIPAGQNWAQEIHRYLNTADIIVLFLSPDFIDSDNNYLIEMKRALERHSQKETHIIVIKLRPFDDRNILISTLQVLPRDGKSVTDHWHREGIISEIAKDIRAAIEKCLLQKLIEEGDIYFAEENFRNALATYEQALQLNPNDATAYNKQGTALLELQEYKQALIAFNQTLQLNPDDATAYSKKGETLINLERPHEALEAFEHALQIHSDEAILYRKRGFIFEELKQNNEALASYERALQLKPDDAITYFFQAGVLFRLKRYEQALLAYDKAIELEPDIIAFYKEKGKALFQLKRDEEALANYGGPQSQDN